MPLMYQTVCQVVANKLQSSSKSNLPKTLHICRKTAAAAAAKSLQSCPTLCEPIDGSPPGSPILGILQARTVITKYLEPFAFNVVPL